MSGDPVQFADVFLVFAATSLLAGVAVFVAVLAFRKSHRLLSLSELIVRRFDPGNQHEGRHQDMARLNLLGLAAFLLLLAFLVCVVGIRIAIA